MSDSKNSSSVSITFSGLLGIVFIVLKLTHVIDWKWVWVLAPIWIGAAFVILVLLFILVIAILAND